MLKETRFRGEFDKLDEYQMQILNETYLGLADTLQIEEPALLGAVAMLVEFIFEETGVFPLTGTMRDLLTKEGLLNA